MSLNVLVASGITSSLFASILTTLQKEKLLDQFVFFAPIRKESNQHIVEELQKHSIHFIAPDADIKFERTLWLSTHTDVDYLTKQAAAMPTLAINSGAILDILNGKQEAATANAYQKEKMALYNVPLLYNFVPGFFIQDVERQPWQSKGLHGDTTKKLFDHIFVDVHDGWWQKTYAVTPMSYITAAVINWLSKPNTFDKTVIMCSQRPFRRFDLRLFAGGLTIAPELENSSLLPVANEQPFAVSSEDVIFACRRAARLYNQQ